MVKTLSELKWEAFCFLAVFYPFKQVLKRSDTFIVEIVRKHS